MGAMADAYSNFAPSVFRLAYSLTGEHAAAEDLLQEAFLRVFSRPRSLHRPEEMSAYLHRATVNLAKSRWRRHQIARRFRALEEPLAKMNAMPPPEPDSAIWHALKRLPIRQRAAVVFHYYEDFTERQVAERLNCSPSAARSLIHRGIKKLRQDLEGRGET